MAKKTNQVQKIWVKKPQLKTEYYFKFAGGVLKGTLAEDCERLTELYGHKWYWIQDLNSTTRYPVSIYDISQDYNNLKHTV